MVDLFGVNRQIQERKKLKKGRKALEGERAEFERERTPQGSLEEQIGARAGEAKKARQEARQEGRTYAEGVLGRDVQGLAPGQKQSMQFEANKQIKRQMQSANRRLLGEQGSRGIIGKSGVGYAQQRDLERIGTEARGQSRRDIQKQDVDVGLKKMAAMFNIEQGEAVQSQLDRQMAQDQLELTEEKRRQRRYEDKFNRLFSRV